MMRAARTIITILTHVLNGTLFGVLMLLVATTEHL